MHKVSIVALAVGACGFLCSVIAMAQPEGPQDVSIRSERDSVTFVMALWAEYLHERVSIGDKLNNLDTILAGKYQDRAAIHWGGTGRRDVLYLIDDYIQIRVIVDGKDRLERTPVAEHRRLWLKHPDGSLFDLPIKAPDKP